MNIYLMGGSIIVFLILLIIAFVLHNSRRMSTKATDYYEKLNNEVMLDKDIESTEEDEKEKQVEEVEPILKEVTEEHYRLYYKLLEKHKMQKTMSKFDALEENIKIDDGYIHMNEMAKELNVELEKVLEYFLKEGYLEREGYNLRLTTKGEEEGGLNIDFEGYTLISWPKEMIDQLYVIKRNRKKASVKNYDEFIGWFWIIFVIAVYFLFFSG